MSKENQEFTPDLRCCNDVFDGHIRLFKLIFEHSEVTTRAIKGFAREMGAQLIEKYNIESNSLDVRFAYEEELIKRLNEII